MPSAIVFLRPLGLRLQYSSIGYSGRKLVEGATYEHFTKCSSHILQQVQLISDKLVVNSLESILVKTLHVGAL